MKMIAPTILLLLVMAFYLFGLLLIPKQKTESLKRHGMIKQEQIIYTDTDGEEREDESLIEVVGVGQVLTYRDIYWATIPFLIVACVLAKVIFNSTDEIRFMIFTTSILGLLLVWLTSKPNVVSTILYWCGIITASFIPKKHECRTERT